jgi:hypothetical protein
LQTAPCQTRSTRRWMTATWTSPLASSGKPTSPISSTRCKRDIRQVPHEKQSRSEAPKWCPHRKIIGVQGVALDGRMAQRPLLATFAIVGMTHDARRYPALARLPTQPDWRIRACTADRSHHQTPHQSQASTQQPPHDPRVLVVPSRAKVVRPQRAPIASLKRRLCGAVIPKVIHFAMHVACS